LIVGRFLVEIGEILVVNHQLKIGEGVLEAIGIESVSRKRIAEKMVEDLHVQDVGRGKVFQGKIPCLFEGGQVF
jgi:hypothetical protein